MGLIKWICSKFICTSNCSFNNELFDIEFSNQKISDYKLKNKDLMVIHKILNKRGLVEINNNNNAISV
tara:strand:- start:331 stop:534 length:204 start_codon:yes stop_codon:yes gene_type:complete